MVQVSTGVHQQFGDCNATDIDLLGYERKSAAKPEQVFGRMGDLLLGFGRLEHEALYLRGALPYRLLQV